MCHSVTQKQLEMENQSDFYYKRIKFISWKKSTHKRGKCGVGALVRERSRSILKTWMLVVC